MDVTALLEEQKDAFKPVTVDKLLPLEFDLGLLSAFDLNEVDVKPFRQSDPEKINTYLHNLSRDNTQLLINALFSLPTQSSDVGVLATLPKRTTELPREKHVPKMKPLTRWQKFATAKGITKTKKSSMVFDEETGEYKPRWGYKSKNKGGDKDWLIEVPQNADPMEDQFAKRKELKKGRVSKNEKHRLKNLEHSIITATGKDVKAAKEEKKTLLEREIVLAKVSTASMGRFDKKVEGEPKIKGVKRKFDDNLADVKEETKKQLDLLEKMSRKKGDVLNVKKAIKSTQ